MEQTLRGIGVSPGIAIGPALLFDLDPFDCPCYSVSDPQAEIKRLDKAIEATREDLSVLYEKTATELGKTHADIFNTHLMLLDDVVLRDEATKALQKEKMNAEHILDKLAKHYAKAMQRVEDPRFQERTADLLDVVNRVLHHLLDFDRPNLKSLSHKSIVVAHELSPSDTATLDLSNTLGLALDSGSATSHSAILARALEIPAVMGLGHLTPHIENGSKIIVDGTAGLIILNPSRETLSSYEQDKAQQEKRRKMLKKVLRGGPCKTTDEVEIPTLANIELPIEIAPSLEAHAQGVGLYRTEYLFLNRDSLPSEDEQYEAYTKVVKAFNPLSVTLRTMDIGGDKFVAHLQISKEDNPQLGWRAVRFCLERPDIFKTQLRAMLRASVHGNVQIMFPMISGMEELLQVKAVLDEVKQELLEENIPYKHDVPVGSMIEVPSAIALTDVLARECDFFSIGTNDLIQYSLAVDRVNQKIAHLYEPAHPAVLRMIGWAARAAKKANIPCSICGEMAGDPLFTELLLGLGVTSLSMSAIALPLLRTEISRTNLKEAKALAQKALKFGTALEIKALLNERFEHRESVDTFLSRLNQEL